MSLSPLPQWVAVEFVQVLFALYLCLSFRHRQQFSSIEGLLPGSDVSSRHSQVIRCATANHLGGGLPSTTQGP